MSKLTSSIGGFYFEFEEVTVTKYTSDKVFVNGNWYVRESHLRIIHPDKKTSQKLLLKAMSVHEDNLLAERNNITKSLTDLSDRREYLEKLVEQKTFIYIEDSSLEDIKKATCFKYKDSAVYFKWDSHNTCVYLHDLDDANHDHLRRYDIHQLTKLGLDIPQMNKDLVGIELRDWLDNHHWVFGEIN